MQAKGQTEDNALFQSTLSQGERQSRIIIRRLHPLFQSTLSQGERRGYDYTCIGDPADFNPRSRKESDSHLPVQDSQASDFNPRSRKESDLEKPGMGAQTKPFQSTLSQGERRVRQLL